MAQALAQTSIAPAMQVLFDAIKTSTIAYITIHDLPMELQLPPYLDSLLKVESDDDVDELQEQDAAEMWGPHMSYGWRLETLAPWKSILLLEKDGFDPFASLRGPHVSVSDRPLVDGLIRFLEVASSAQDGDASLAFDIGDPHDDVESFVCLAVQPFHLCPIAPQLSRARLGVGGS